MLMALISLYLGREGPHGAGDQQAAAGHQPASARPQAGSCPLPSTCWGNHPSSLGETPGVQPIPGDVALTGPSGH